MGVFRNVACAFAAKGYHDVFFTSVPYSARRQVGREFPYYIRSVNWNCSCASAVAAETLTALGLPTCRDLRVGALRQQAAVRMAQLAHSKSAFISQCLFALEARYRPAASEWRLARAVCNRDLCIDLDTRMAWEPPIVRTATIRYNCVNGFYTVFSLAQVAASMHTDSSTSLAQALLGPELYAQVEIVGRYVARYYAQESCDAS